MLILIVIGLIGCTTETPESSITELKRRTVDPRVGLFLQQGQQAFQQGLYGQALAMADSAQRYAPDLADAYYLRGRVLMERVLYAQADSAYQQVLDLDPKYPSGWYYRGQTAFLDGKYRKAIGLYQKERTPDGLIPPEALLQIGRSYLKLEQIDSAATHYQQALAQDSTYAQAYGWMSEFYETEGDLEKALVYAQRGLALDPENTEYGYQVGSLLFRTGAVEPAIPQLEAVIAAEPWHPGAHYNLGRALMAVGRTEEGEAILGKVEWLQLLESEIGRAHLEVYQHPDQSVRWANLALLLRESGQMDESRKAGYMAQLLRAQEMQTPTP